MCEGLPAVPPVDRDDSEKQRKAQAHLVFPSASSAGFLRVPTRHRRRMDAELTSNAIPMSYVRGVETTILCLLHSLLSEIQEC
jgi:hypothetical protein